MTHAELVLRATQWVKSRTTFVVCELRTFASEVPDVWGYGYQYSSLSVEYKASRSDFLKDAKKRHRANPERAMGHWRYYMCPPGIITVDDLPVDWGLLYCHPRKVEEVKRASPQEYSESAERLLMASIIRRTIEKTGCGKHLCN